MKRVIAVALLLAFVGTAHATINAFQFDDPAQAETFQRLSNELRCLVCQNQNLADSNAELAQDLRREIYRMVREGKDEQAIIDFMVSRYGDFVLYRPPVNRATWLLWVGPFLLLAVGAGVMLVMVRGRTRAPAAELSAEERARLQGLLRSGGKGNLEQ
jgi:cytochrome c-type biogenesis protein CcmH